MNLEADVVVPGVFVVEGLGANLVFVEDFVSESGKVSGLWLDSVCLDLSEDSAVETVRTCGLESEEKF